MSTMPQHYKEKREELDDILWHFNVPRKFYNRLKDLRNYLVSSVAIATNKDQEKIMCALEIIEEIMPRITSETIYEYRKNNL